MPKLYKAVTKNEDKCKKMHRDMCMAGNMARLEQNLFLIADTDELQKQVKPEDVICWKTTGGEISVRDTAGRKIR